MPPPPDLALPHPFPEPPAPGRTIEIAPGILWARLPLPFRLNHVNIYLIDDGDGWAVIDAGIGNDETRGMWERLLGGPLAGKPLKRLLITHNHPDHVGAAGWLAKAHGLEIEMSETEYLSALVLHLDPDALGEEPYRSFYEENGLAAEVSDLVLTRGHDYLRMLTGLPATFRRLIAGERVRLGGRDFEVFTGGGHSSEQVMLFSAEDNLFLSADQVLPRISPNIGVYPRDPLGDPLGIFLRSLRALKAAIPDEALVLPGHDLPFRGLGIRADGLAQHHEERCAAIVAACRKAPRSAAELVTVVFRRELDPHQTGFAFGEVMAHVNYLLRRDRLFRDADQDGIRRVRAG